MRLKGEDVTTLRRGLEFERNFIGAKYISKSFVYGEKAIKEASKIKALLNLCDRETDYLKSKEMNEPDYDTKYVIVSSKDIKAVVKVLAYCLDDLRAKANRFEILKLTEMRDFAENVYTLAYNLIEMGKEALNEKQPN